MQGIVTVHLYLSTLARAYENRFDQRYAHSRTPLYPLCTHVYPLAMLVFWSRTWVSLSCSSFCTLTQVTQPVHFLLPIRRHQSPPCRVHVFVHGCGQQAAAGPTPYAMNDTYARRAGFNELAESNGFVVLYPQISYGDRATCLNERGGCWDQVILAFLNVGFQHH